LLENWSFDLWEIKQLLICQRLLSSRGTHCPFFVWLIAIFGIDFSHCDKINCIFVKTQPIFVKPLWEAMFLWGLHADQKLRKKLSIHWATSLYIKRCCHSQNQGKNRIISNNLINFYLFFEPRQRIRTSQQDAAIAKSFTIVQKLRTIECYYGQRATRERSRPFSRSEKQSIWLRRCQEVPKHKSKD